MSDLFISFWSAVPFGWIGFSFLIGLVLGRVWGWVLGEQEVRKIITQMQPAYFDRNSAGKISVDDPMLSHKRAVDREIARRLNENKKDNNFGAHSSE